MRDVDGSERATPVVPVETAAQAEPVEPVEPAEAATPAGGIETVEAAGGTESWPTGRLLSTAARLVEHAWVEGLAEIGLTHAGLIALHLLDAGPMNQTDLAQRARVQTQTMSRTVDRLERQGFIERKPDENDRRRQLVSRTDAGAEAWRKTRTLEADLFPATDDPDGLRHALLAIISATSGARWTDAR